MPISRMQTGEGGSKRLCGVTTSVSQMQTCGGSKKCRFCCWEMVAYLQRNSRFWGKCLHLCAAGQRTRMTPRVTRRVTRTTTQMSRNTLLRYGPDTRTLESRSQRRTRQRWKKSCFRNLQVETLIGCVVVYHQYYMVVYHTIRRVCLYLNVFE